MRGNAVSQEATRMALTDYENGLLSQCRNCGGHSSVTVYERDDIVLFWPHSWVEQPNQAPGVTGVTDTASWFQAAYRQMCEWRQLDPNEYYLRENGVRQRLVFACNGKKDFQIEDCRREPLLRPYIGLRDGKSPTYGSNDWFGWLCHELSHDFLHKPRLGPDAEHWGDGLCDYFRCKLLAAQGMDDAAVQFEHAIRHRAAQNASDTYAAPAQLLLDYEDNPA